MTIQQRPTLIAEKMSNSYNMTQEARAHIQKPTPYSHTASQEKQAPAKALPAINQTASASPTVDEKQNSPSTETEVRWQNQVSTAREGQFTEFAASASVDIAQYLGRISGLVAMGSCHVVSISATNNSININVLTELSTDEMMARIKKCNLFPALRLEDIPWWKRSALFP